MAHVGHNLTLGCLLASVGCCRFTLLIIRNVLDAGAASEMPQDTPQAVFSHSYLHVIYDFFTSATAHYCHLHPKVIRIWSNMLTSLLEDDTFLSGHDLKYPCCDEVLSGRYFRNETSRRV